MNEANSSNDLITAFEWIEEAALARAIDEGRDTPRVTREEIFQILEGVGALSIS